MNMDPSFYHMQGRGGGRNFEKSTTKTGEIRRRKIGRKWEACRCGREGLATALSHGFQRNCTKVRIPKRYATHA